MDTLQLKDSFELYKQSLKERKEYYSQMSEEQFKILMEGLDTIYKNFEDDKIPTETPNFDMTVMIPAIWTRLKGDFDIKEFIKIFTEYDLEGALTCLIADGIRYNNNKN